MKRFQLVRYNDRCNCCPTVGTNCVTVATLSQWCDWETHISFQTTHWAYKDAVWWLVELPVRGCLGNSRPYSPHGWISDRKASTRQLARSPGLSRQHSEYVCYSCHACNEIRLSSQQKQNSQSKTAALKALVHSYLENGVIYCVAKVRATVVKP